MRILDQAKVMIELDELGMLPQALERFTKAFSQAARHRPRHRPDRLRQDDDALRARSTQLNTIETNIITIEDPVEYQLDGITQVQVNPQGRPDLRRRACARSCAQDPDIIMVGEIRDRETAQIAVQAALTGHLVLSTLHTNDAPGADHPPDRHGHRALPGRLGGRLRRRPAPRAPALRGVQAPHDDHRPRSMRANGFNVGLDLEAYEPVGCARCGGSGYKGRIGLYEVMWVTDTIRALAVAREPAETIAHAAVHEGMMRLREDGLEKVRRGLTSIAEIARVAGTR